MIFNNGLGGNSGSAETNGMDSFFGNGIFLDPSVGHVIDGNVINGNGFTGIQLDFIEDSYINNNTIENNGEFGVFFYNSNDNIITLNYIQYNGNGTIADYGNTNLKINSFFGNGIFLDPSNGNFISDNVLLRNGGYGVDIDLNSTTNTVQTNDFIENSDFTGTAQANDDGDYNQFAGNYYSDGQGSSSPYDVDGGAGSQDTTPLDYPTYFPTHELTEPTVIFPNGGEKLSGEITILWNESVDSWDHEVTYDIWWSWDRGVLWEQIAWDVTETTFTVDSTTVLHDGQNNLFKVIAKDGRGMTAEDTSDDRFVIKNAGGNNKNNNFLIFDTTTTGAIQALAGFTPIFVAFALPAVFLVRRYKNNK
jgi:parallel beta-helix repeat protein